MGFVNLEYGLRAIGYLEPDPLPRGPVAFISHSGSAFSALLRSQRRLGFTLAVSSGQELVTSAASYLDYALDLPGTGIVALLLETLREPEAFRAALARAAEREIPVVALTVGGSPTGRAMVAAHSGALAGDDGAWEALFDAYGVLRVRDLDEMTDTLELFAAGRRAPPTSGGGGIATVHDSGAERALVVDLADSLGVPFAPISGATHERLRGAPRSRPRAGQSPRRLGHRSRRSDGVRRFAAGPCGTTTPSRPSRFASTSCPSSTTTSTPSSP